MELHSFEEFWPYYMGEHRNPVCRGLHYFGTTGALLIIIASIATMHPALLFAFPVFGYGFAWIGHFFVEKNKPASFKYPGWSLLGDLKMISLLYTGRMGAELARLQKADFRFVPQAA